MLGPAYCLWQGPDFVLGGRVSVSAGGGGQLPCGCPAARASCHLPSTSRVLVDAEIRLGNLTPHLGGEDVAATVEGHRASGLSNNLENRK
jgi:hypothetical protein